MGEKASRKQTRENSIHLLSLGCKSWESAKQEKQRDKTRRESKNQIPEYPQQRLPLLLFLFPWPAPDDSVSCVHRGAAPRKDAATKSEARFYGSLYLLISESRSDMWAMYDNAQNGDYNTSRRGLIFSWWLKIDYEWWSIVAPAGNNLYV